MSGVVCCFMDRGRIGDWGGCYTAAKIQITKKQMIERRREGEGRRRQAGCWRPRNVAGCSRALRAKRSRLQNCHNEWHTLCYARLSRFIIVCFNMRGCQCLLIKIILKMFHLKGVNSFLFCRPKCLIYLLGISHTSSLTSPYLLTGSHTLTTTLVNDFLINTHKSTDSHRHALLVHVRFGVKSRELSLTWGKAKLRVKRGAVSIVTQKCVIQ